MKNTILYKIILIAGAILTTNLLYAAPGDPPLLEEAPLDSMMFLPITVAIGLVAIMTKRRKK